MKKSNHTFILVYILTCFLFNLNSLFAEQIVFKQISLEQGLSQSKVVAICRDYEGYLWAGTEDGINRINQSVVKTYNFDYSDSLRGNFIYFIEEDFNKNLWVGTNKGLLIYNRLTDEFESSDFKNIAYTACYAEADQIIFKAYDHLLILSDKGPAYIQFANNKLHNPSCRIVRKDPDHLILTGYWQGIYELNLKTGQLRGLPVQGLSAYTSVAKDQNGNYWIGFYGDGIKCLDRDLNVIKELKFDNASNSNHNLVMDIAVDSNNLIWVVTDGGGLKCINPNSFEISEYVHAQGLKSSLPVNNLLNIYIDINKSIWIGSVSGGLICVDNPEIKSYQEAITNTHYGLSHNILTCFAKSDSTIWIGTDGNGINSYDTRNSQFKHYPSTFDLSITSVIDWNKEQLIAVVYNKGIFYFDKKNGRLDIISELHAINQNVQHTQVSPGIYKLDDNSIFIASTHCYYYNFRIKELIDLSKQGNFKHHPSLRLAGRTDNYLYLYDGDKIIRYDMVKKEIQRFVTFNPYSIGSIASMTRLDNNTFWFITRTGLFCFTPDNNKLFRYKLPGLENPTMISNIAGLSLGIGTKEKFINYQPYKGKISFYDVSDGLLVNEYSRRGYMVDHSDSVIYVGGVNGMSIVPLNKPVHNEKTGNNIILTDIWVNGEKVAYNPQINKDNFPELSAGISKLEFHLNNKEANLFKSPIFRYRLIGFDSRFKSTSDYTLTYFNLDPGSYTLEIQYQLTNGLWSDYETLTTIRILPYWWDSMAFKICLTLLLLTGIGGLFYKEKKDQLRKVEEKMREYEKEMYQKKIQFFESVNHELRTPLTLITGPINRLLKETSKLNPDTMDTLRKVSKQTDYMKNVINMVLDIRKLDLGVTEMNYKSTDLVMYLRDIKSEFDDAYEHKNVGLEFISSIERATVYIDRLKIKIILVNLLNNALKFSESNGKVILGLSENNGTIEIYVSDQGIGLKQTDLENLFSSFYQGKHDKEGNGIGLYYSRMLIHLMGGEITAKNNEDQGATFIVRIPSDNKSMSIPEAKETSDEYHFSNDREIFTSGDQTGYTILLVEDIEEMRCYLSEELRTVFPNILCAANGKEAYEILKKQNIDIVISDIMMPVMNGYELCSLIKQDIDLSHIPVILLTALCEEHNIKTGYGCGANAYLPKPFDTEALIQLLQTLIHQQLMLKERFKENSFAIVPEELAHSNLDKTFIDKLIQVINEHIEKPELDVDFICDKMAVSRSTLYSKMKSYIGKGVKELINDIRIEKAKALLKQTDLPISEISEKIGFAQQRYFSRVFKSEVGMTPSEFRSENK